MCIARHTTANGESTRQQRCPARGADTGPRVEIGPFLALVGHTVQVGGFDGRMPEAAQVPIAQIVGKYDDKIRWVLFNSEVL